MERTPLESWRTCADARKSKWKKPWQLGDTCRAGVDHWSRSGVSLTTTNTTRAGWGDIAIYLGRFLWWHLYMGWKRLVEEDHHANLSAQLQRLTQLKLSRTSQQNLHWRADTAPTIPKLFLWGSSHPSLDLLELMPLRGSDWKMWNLDDKIRTSWHGNEVTL